MTEAYQCDVSWCSNLESECVHSEDKELVTDGGTTDKDRSDTAPCPYCNGTGEVERPTCPFEDCNEKMIQYPSGDQWVCPVHSAVIL